MIDINTILQGDALELAKSLPDNFCHCIVTSPPYWQLRDYQTGTWYGGSGECDHVKDRTNGINSSTLQGGKLTTNHQQEAAYKDTCLKCGATRIDAQMGLEETPELYIENMVVLFRELRRVLRKDGTLWLNMGDSYAANGQNGRGFNEPRTQYTTNSPPPPQGRAPTPPGLKSKDLCGIPWRLALALQADGWVLRSDIVWSKKNPMPESVTDRPTKAHEYLFLLTKSPKYFYDAEAIREKIGEPTRRNAEYRGDTPYKNGQSFNNSNKHDGFSPRGDESLNGRNRRSVWEIALEQDTFADYTLMSLANDYPEILKSLVAQYTDDVRIKSDIWNIATQPYPEAHFATFPEALIEPCILAGTSAKGVCGVCGGPWERVLDNTLTGRGKTQSKLEDGIHTKSSAKSLAEKRQAYRAMGLEGPPPPKTTGWQPTCKCIKNRTPNFGMKGSELLELADEIAREFAPVPAIVLDPFMGSGTTGSVAKRLGRYYLGFELNPDYIKLALKRINNTQPPLFILT